MPPNKKSTIAYFRPNVIAPAPTIHLEAGKDFLCDRRLAFQVRGVGGVGKSSLIASYLGNQAIDNQGLAADRNTKIILFQEQSIELQIWDASRGLAYEPQRIKSHAKTQPRSTNVCFIVFDLTEKLTLKYVGDYLYRLQKEQLYSHDTSHIILIGNKADAVEHRAISKELISAYLRRYADDYFLTIDAYIEASARTGLNVNFAFETAIKLALGQELKHELSPSEAAIDQKSCACKMM